jgi:hypothetical protein
LHIRRQQQCLIDIPGAKILAHGSSLNQTRSKLNSDYSDRLLERPMFPPRADAQIIQFSSFAAAKSAKEATTKVEEGADRSRRLAKNAARLLEATTAPETLTESCRNHRLRLSRKEAWFTASRLTHFYRARMDWHSALSCAQSWEVPGAEAYPNCEFAEGRGTDVSLWRAALVAQMLTPAPTVNDVQWKRIQLRAGQHKFTDVPESKLQRAIDADVAWLAAHPSRKSIAASRQAKKGE